MHLVLDGDSLMQGGSYTPMDWTGTVLLPMLRAPCTHQNLAQGGTGLETRPGVAWDSSSVPRYRRIYVLNSGINNLVAIASGGPSVATIQGYEDALITAILNAGFLAFVWSTMIASTAHDTVQGRGADRLTLNDARRAKSRADGRLILVDPAADSFFQNPPNYQESDSGDGDTHPGKLGTTDLMTFYADAINRIL